MLPLKKTNTRDKKKGRPANDCQVPKAIHEVSQQYIHKLLTFTNKKQYPPLEYKDSKKIVKSIASSL